jgi:hypothetical protein
MFTIDDIAIAVGTEPEDLSIRGNYIVSGDADYDRKCEDDIISQLDSGNEWAWCRIRVDVTPKSLNYVDIITGYSLWGGCSYENREEFIKSDTYNEMVMQALDDLNFKAERMYNGLKDKFSSTNKVI